MTRFSSSCGAIVVCLLAISVFAERLTGEEIPPVASSNESTPRVADPDAIHDWQSKRFGMFIHWGPVALTGHEIGWSRSRETPIDEYDQLYKQFDPEQFNADQWARVAKDAGMTYVVITTKHHDGFCLWPSQYTDYHIGNSPFKRDVLKELSEACRKHGIAFGTYYSVCDWYHPDYPKGSPAGKSDKPNPNLDRYMQFLQNQTAELVNNYGPLLTMWFDVPREVDEQRGTQAILALRKLQSNIVVNNRAYKGEGSGDYDTPEQRVGGFNRDRPWETCMTICRQWAWKPNDTMKSRKQCIQTLLRTVGGDGNLLFNVGPMPDGRIELRQVQRLKEMGQWVKAHGQAIYGTRGGPFKPGKWGTATCKDDKVYLFVMSWPKDGPLVLPAIDAKVNSARLLDGGTVKLQQNNESIRVDVPADQRDEIATAVELTVDGPALDIEPVAVVHRSDALSYGKKATASNVFQKTTQYGPDKALDDDPETRWATDAGTAAAWIEIDLAQPTAISRIHIDEPGPLQRVQAFELQHHDGATWKTFHAGTTIGPNWSKAFTPVTAQRFRLNISEASDGPTIGEIQLFAPEK